MAEKINIERDDYYDIIKLLLTEMLSVPNGWKEEVYIDSEGYIYFSGPMGLNSYTESPRKVAEIEHLDPTEICEEEMDSIEEYAECMIEDVDVWTFFTDFVDEMREMFESREFEEDYGSYGG